MRLQGHPELEVFGLDFPMPRQGIDLVALNLFRQFDFQLVERLGFRSVERIGIAIYWIGNLSFQCLETVGETIRPINTIDAADDGLPTHDESSNDGRGVRDGKEGGLVGGIGSSNKFIAVGALIHIRIRGRHRTRGPARYHDWWCFLVL